MPKDHFSGIERRRFKRLNKAFVVRVREGEYNDWDVVMIHNISRGGMLFRIELPLKAGAILALKINIGLNKEAISCYAKVIHVKALAPESYFCEVGVE